MWTQNKKETRKNGENLQQNVCAASEMAGKCNAIPWLPPLASPALVMPTSFLVGFLKFFREVVQTADLSGVYRWQTGAKKQETEKEDKEWAHESISIFNVSAEFIM